MKTSTKTRGGAAVTNIKPKTLICIVGPTGVGKTSVAISLAKNLQTEIISADSRQFYREMSIGTAKPTTSELAESPHHFVGQLSVTQTYSAGDFERDALAKINELFSTRDVVLMVGGSGLFIQAVCRGMDELPVVDEQIRQKYNRLFEDKGIEPLQLLLAEKDPEYYAKVDRQNPQRLIRALEVIEATGQTFSQFQKKNFKERPFQIHTIGLVLPREKLYQRINARVDEMIREGLLDEVKSLIAFRNTYALKTVGYSELFRFLDGEISLEEAIDLIKQNTRRYAKRQLTWFRKNPETRWFSPGDLPDINEFIQVKTAQA